VLFDFRSAENVADAKTSHEQRVGNQLPMTSPEDGFGAAIHGGLFFNQRNQNS
jgi:hypothetical protein